MTSANQCSSHSELISNQSSGNSAGQQDSTGMKKGTNNWMRERWVANLKKKRTENSGSIGNQIHTSASRVHNNSRKHSGRSRHLSSQAYLGRSNAAMLNSARHGGQYTTNCFESPSDKKSLNFPNTAMLFNELGCFEFDSPHFAQVTPNTIKCLIDINNCGNDLEDLTDILSPNKRRNKKFANSMPKKRSPEFLSLDWNHKPRTPRRKLNSGTEFDDTESLFMPACHMSGIQSTSSSTEMHGKSRSFPQHNETYTSVGTPSNCSPDTSRLWETELDFGAASSYVSSFLDIPTPKSSISISNGTPESNQTGHDQLGSNTIKLETPKLTRSSSIERENLRHVFEQTKLNGTINFEDTHGINQNDSALGDDTKSRNISLSPNQLVMSESSSSLFPSHKPYTPQHEVLGVVDDFLDGSKMSGNCFRLSQHWEGLTQTGRRRSLSEGHAYELNKYAHQNPEFEALLEDCKFTDIDQELNNFYIETMESFGSGTTAPQGVSTNPNSE